MREQVDQLWYAIIGTNGEGLIGKVNKQSETLREFLDTRAQTCPVNQRETEEERQRALRRDKIRNRIMAGSLTVAAFSVILSFLVAIFK